VVDTGGGLLGDTLDVWKSQWGRTERQGKWGEGLPRCSMGMGENRMTMNSASSTESCGRI
jgi:hypothetical protein